MGAIAEHEQIAAHPGSPPSRAYTPFAATSGPLTPLQQQPLQEPSSPSGLSDASARHGSGTMEVVKGIWPVMISLFLSGTVGIMVFPFFTYATSSGWLKDLLPKVSLAATTIGL